MINYGNGMIFPDAWAGGPPDPPEGPECALCGDTGYAENSYEDCPACGAMSDESGRTDERLYREYIVCQAAGYPDPHKPHPMTLENAQRFAAEHRKPPTFPAIIRTRLVSEWVDAE